MGRAYLGRWKGLKEDGERANPLIIWPPMVVFQNTKLELDEDEKVRANYVPFVSYTVNKHNTREISVDMDRKQ